MLNIMICEDNIEQLIKIKRYIKDIIMIENFDMEIVLATSKPEDIISHLKKNKISGLYFLDVDLNSNINGIKLAEIIREYDPRGFIVFVTTHAEMSYLTFIYKVEAMDYIIKDTIENVKQRIHECILNAQKSILQSQLSFKKILHLK